MGRKQSNQTNKQIKELMKGFRRKSSLLFIKKDGNKIIVGSCHLKEEVEPRITSHGSHNSERYLLCHFFKKMGDRIVNVQIQDLKRIHVGQCVRYFLKDFSWVCA